MSMQLPGVCSDEDHGPLASEEVSILLGELFSNVVGMADVVKQVQIEIAKLKEENKFLRRHQKLAVGGERRLRVAARPPKEPMPPTAFVELPHAPTEPPPDLAEEEELASMQRRCSKGAGRLQLLELPPGQRSSTISVKSDRSSIGASPQPSTKNTASSALSKVVAVQSLKSLTQGSLNPNGKAQLSSDKTFLSSGSSGKELGSPREWKGVRTLRTHVAGLNRDGAGGNGGLRAMLFDPEAVKQRMRENIAKRDFDVTRFYNRTGYAQKLARSHTFHSIASVAICLNTIWIAVDTEHNREDVLVDADVGFQVVEHCFCVFFCAELMIRFGAFQSKRNCFRSGWFVFEACLVIAMVFDDWVMTLVLLATGRHNSDKGIGLVKNVAILRMLRLLRLLRLGRCAKLMSQSPDLMIMIKAVLASARYVVWTCVMLACLFFFFGVCFTQICKDSSLEAEYFGSLTSSMHTLFIAGLFPDLDYMSRTINKAHFLYWALFLIYLVITCITVLNLLIGVLVEVAQSSAKIERDTMDVTGVKDVFASSLCLDEIEDFSAIKVGQEEFVDLLQDQSILKGLTRLGIDVFGLIDLLDFIFMDGPVGFVELMEVVMQLRSSANVTVRDLVEVRKFLTYELSKLHAEFSKLALGARENAKGHLS